MIEAMGGCCCICGYDRSPNALEFHHLDPGEKDFRLSSATASPKSWATIVEELKKCVMLCANCHREVHDGTAVVADSAPRFNTGYEDYRVQESAMKTSPCPVCLGPKKPDAVTCSRSCAGALHPRADWSGHDVSEMRKTMSLCEIGRIVGVSDKAVSKRIKKLRNASE